MGGTRLESDGTVDAKIIRDAVRELKESNIKLQEDNKKATEKYIVITVIATFTSTISGILIGKYILI